MSYFDDQLVVLDGGITISHTAYLAFGDTDSRDRARRRRRPAWQATTRSW